MKRKKVVVLIMTKKQAGGTLQAVLKPGTVIREQAAILSFPPRVEGVDVQVPSGALAEIPLHMRRLCGGKRHRTTGYA